ncbi:MAG: DMT family transporter [Chloroflexi bacterium]|nr:DMT family transporter [Chloroflexota bacterium]
MQPTRFTRKGLLQNQVLLGSFAAILAAVCYGSSQFLARQIVKNQDLPSLVVATFALLTGFVLLSFLSLKNIREDRRAPRKALLLMALAGFAASMGVAFNYTALSLAPVVVVAPISAASPLISLTLANLFLHRLERITLRIWLGAVLVVGGVILVVLGTA